MSLHPIIKKAVGLPSDIVEMAKQQAGAWDAMVSQLQTLEAGDPNAEEVLRNASALLSSITINFGNIHGWSLAQHHIIYRTACRVFGAEQLIISKPNWSESY